MGILTAIYNFAVDYNISVAETGIAAVPADKVLQNALNIAYFVAGIICVIVIVIAAITYTVSRGNAESITRAKNMLLYAVIGLVGVMVAFGVTWFIVGRI